MASLLIRRLDQSIKDALKARATQHGRSMEAEARAIIERELEGAKTVEGGAAPRTKSAWDVFRASLAETGGFDLVIERDQTPYEPRVRFDDDP